MLTLGILVLAAAIRFWKLGWGLASLSFFPDEQQIWPKYLFAFIPLGWESFLRPERWPAFIYPTFYGNLAGLTVAGAYRLGWIIEPWKDFASALYYARAVTAGMSVATVGLVALIGRRLYGGWTGVVAAAFMALVPLDALQAHYANVDGLLGALICVSILLAWKVLQTGSATWGAAAGFVVGLATGTKYNGLAMGAVVAWAGLETAWAKHSIRPLVAIGLASIAGLVFGFATACPACLLQSEYPAQAVANLSLASRTENLLFWRADLVPTLGWYGRPVLWHLLAGLPYALGWPLYLAAMAGLVRALASRTAADRLLLVALAAWFFPVVTVVLDLPRYLVPLAPALTVLGARFLLDLPGRWTAAGIATAVCAYSFLLTTSQISRLDYSQQAEIAHWIRTTVPERTDGERRRIGLPAHRAPYFRLQRPLESAGLTPVPVWNDDWFTTDVDAFVLPRTHEVEVHRLRPGSDDERVVDLLLAGESGFREVARWTPRYFDEDVYVAIDPGFTGDLLFGQQGFRVFVRDPNVPTGPGLDP